MKIYVKRLDGRVETVDSASVPQFVMDTVSLGCLAMHGGELYSPSEAYLERDLTAEEQAEMLKELRNRLQSA